MDATLSVKSYGRGPSTASASVCRRASELASNNPSAYSIVAVEEDDPPAAAPAAAPGRGAAGQENLEFVDVRLTTVRSGRSRFRPASGSSLPVLRWSALPRQWGSIAVMVVGDWQVLWGGSRGVRRVDQLPESLARQGSGGRLRVLRAALFAERRALAAKQTHISVEPEYLLLVDADQVRLDAKLKYTVRGAKVFDLQINLADWELDEVGPENLVADIVPAGAAGEFAIPLQQLSAGQFEVRLRAHRPIAPGATTLAVKLPQPHSSGPESAIVAVLPADNVELIPDAKAMTGLVRQQAGAAVDLPPRQQEPLFYRNEASNETTNAVFVAGLRRHAQQIGVDVASRLDLDEQGVSVEENLSYTIAYEPADHLLIEVPYSLTAPGRLELFVGDQPVAAETLPENSGRALRMRIALPKACIGGCQLTARYRLPLQKPPAADHALVAVPLVMPASESQEVKLAGNKLSVRAAPGLRVEAGKGPWTAVAESSAQAPAGPRSLQLTATRRVAQAQFKVQWETGSAAAVVERAWVQTWLTGSARQDARSSNSPPIARNWS